jgi:ADP-ribosylglycohydrolase
LQAIEMLGEGWVAEETLAIAVYCALKHQDSFEDAIIAAVNHSGDSDSTGSVTGNILGAYFGYDKIPEKFLTNLELRELIEELATDLYEDCKMSEYSGYRDPVWISKYIDNDYGKDREW